MLTLPASTNFVVTFVNLGYWSHWSGPCIRHTFRFETSADDQSIKILFGSDPKSFKEFIVLAKQVLPNRIESYQLKSVTKMSAKVLRLTVGIIGGRHSSVDSFAPPILRSRVQIPSALIRLFPFILLYYICHVM